jgi:FAD/FMN-containing dehydrogenase
MPRTPPPSWLIDLAQSLGPQGLLLPGVNASDVDLLPLEQDWRGRYRGRALAVACPASAQEAQQVVRACRDHGVSIVPQGGNTGLVGGGIPDDSGQQMLIKLHRLNRVLSVDVANLSMTVQAGCTLAQVQEAAHAHGLLFPLSLAAEGSCTIGGNLATNAGGTQVLRHGTARELCLGLEVVTPSGERWSGLSALRKNNTGYDLRDLFIGSEGTLGLITAASLKLYPRPATQTAALATCESLQACVDLLHMTRQHLDAQLTAFEVMGQAPMQLVARHLPDIAKVAQGLSTPGQPEGPMAAAPWTVLLEASHPRPPNSANDDPVYALLNQAMTQGLVSQAIVSQSQLQHRAMWALREAIPMAEKAEGLMVKHDIGVPTSQIPAFVNQASMALDAAVAGHQLVCFGHLGDGNLHFNVGAPAGQDAQAFVAAQEGAINAVVYDVVARFEGTISAEHGIGQLKRDELAQRQSPVALGLMRAIKQALDPQGLFNPGRVL